MTLVDANALFDYWDESPPEHELGALFARVYTTWGKKEMTIEDHRHSLEERWNSGQAMNAKQLYEALGGGRITVDQHTTPPVDPRRPPGIGPFPGIN